MAETITVRGENLTVELILHRRFGVEGRSLINETLRINPGLSSLGAFLPLGTTFTLPEKPAAEPDVVPLKSLFR